MLKWLHLLSPRWGEVLLPMRPIYHFCSSNQWQLLLGLWGMNAPPKISLMLPFFSVIRLPLPSSAKLHLAAQPLPPTMWAVLCPLSQEKSRHSASATQPLHLHLSEGHPCAFSTAPTQVAAILEKSREDIGPCVERLLEVPQWLTAITGVSEVKGVMSNWGLFSLQGCQTLSACAPYGEK